MTTKKIFSAFAPSDKNVWKQQAIKDLKGKDYDDTLVWRTSEGVAVEPYYTVSDLEEIVELPNLNAKWLNMPCLKYVDEKSTNRAMIDYLSKGAEAVWLDLSKDDVEMINFPMLLNQIKLNETPILFQIGGQVELLVDKLKNFLHYNIKGGVFFDAVSEFLYGEKIAADTWENTKNAILKTADNTAFKTVIINGSTFHEAGANTVQELAGILSSLVLHLDKLTDEGLTAIQVANKVLISLSVGTNYFFEIAKLRALRILVAEILNDYAVENVEIPIHTQTSVFYDAQDSPYTNLLRHTTEAMSAVIGGADYLTVRTYNGTFEESDDFAERIARNVSVLLRDESHLDKVADPASGSYYLEKLSQNLAEEAWAMFTEIEASGGLLVFAESGELKKSINQSFEKLQTKTMLGVNKYREESNTQSSETIEVLGIPTWSLSKRSLASVLSNV